MRCWLLRVAPQHIVDRLREVPLVLSHSIDRALQELAGSGDVIIVPGRGPIPAPGASQLGAASYGSSSRSQAYSTPLSAIHGSLAAAPFGAAEDEDAPAAEGEGGGGGEEEGVEGGEGVAAGASVPGEEVVDDVEPEAPPSLAPQPSWSRRAGADALQIDLDQQEVALATTSEDATTAPATAADAKADDSALEACVPPVGSTVALVNVPLLTVSVCVWSGRDNAPSCHPAALLSLLGYAGRGVGPALHAERRHGPLDAAAIRGGVVIALRQRAGPRLSTSRAC